MAKKQLSEFIWRQSIHPNQLILNNEDCVLNDNVNKFPKFNYFPDDNSIESQIRSLVNRKLPFKNLYVIYEEDELESMCIIL